MLPQRNVYISLDGPDESTNILTERVLSIAEDWKKDSKHSISIWQSDANLGLLLHFQIALKSFFSCFDFGLVLEDDMEFRSEFVDFLDSNDGKSYLLRYWSICGHNPVAKSDLTFKKFGLDILFFETSVHTIWGWAASSNSINFYLEYVDKSSRNSISLTESLSIFTRSLTNDWFFRSSVRTNWKGKIHRAVSSNKPNWDNYWVLAGWSSGKYSLMPNYSLSRENPIIFGIQTHEHINRGQSWELVPNLIVSPEIRKRSRRKDRELVSVWGNSRFHSYKRWLRQLFIGKIKD